MREGNLVSIELETTKAEFAYGKQENNLAGAHYLTGTNWNQRPQKAS